MILAENLAKQIYYRASLGFYIIFLDFWPQTAGTAKNTQVDFHKVKAYNRLSMDAYLKPAGSPLSKEIVNIELYLNILPIIVAKCWEHKELRHPRRFYLIFFFISSYFLI